MKILTKTESNYVDGGNPPKLAKVLDEKVLPYLEIGGALIGVSGFFVLAYMIYRRSSLSRYISTDYSLYSILNV